MFFFILYNYLDSLKWVLLIWFFIFYFRKEIKNLFNRIREMKLPGGVNLQLQQSESVQDNKEIEKIEREKSTDELLTIIENKETTIGNKDNDIFRLTLEKHFEYTYRLIFRSQIYLLQNMQTLSDGLSVQYVNNHFENTKNTYEALNSWTVEIYTKFLFDQNLIEKDSSTNKFKITTIGELFIKYLLINNYDFNNEKNL